MHILVKVFVLYSMCSKLSVKATLLCNSFVLAIYEFGAEGFGNDFKLFRLVLLVVGIVGSWVFGVLEADGLRGSGHDRDTIL